jgi:hypothetical protein
MDATRIFLDICDVFARVYFAICRKTYVSVKVQFVPQKDEEAAENKRKIAFTIINESGPDIEVRDAWFLTSFNRRIFSKALDSKMPIRVRSRDRETYFMPIVEELSAALNKNVGEKITQAVLFDKAQNLHTGRLDKAVELAI